MDIYLNLTAQDGLKACLQKTESNTEELDDIDNYVFFSVLNYLHNLLAVV